MKAGHLGIFGPHGQDLAGTAALALEAQAAVPGPDVEHALAREIFGKFHVGAHRLDRILARRVYAVKDLPPLMPVDAGKESVRVETRWCHRDTLGRPGHDLFL